MLDRYRISKLAAVRGSYDVGITVADLKICPMHHRKSHARTVRNKQFLIEVLMQVSEGNSVLETISIIDPRW